MLTEEKKRSHTTVATFKIEVVVSKYERENIFIFTQATQLLEKTVSATRAERVEIEENTEGIVSQNNLIRLAFCKKKKPHFGANHRRIINTRIEIVLSVVRNSRREILDGERRNLHPDYLFYESNIFRIRAEHPLQLYRIRSILFIFAREADGKKK